MLRRLSSLLALAVLLAAGAFALALRGGSPRATVWRAHLRSLAADRDGDVRNNLLRDGGDPFALRRMLLAAPASGPDGERWRAFTAAAAAPRPDYDALDTTAAGLETLALPRDAAAAYRYLHLWSFWQRNRPGSAGAILAGLVEQGLPAARAAAALGGDAGPDGAVQLAVAGPLRTAATGGRLRYRLRNLEPLGTRRLAIRCELSLTAPPAGRTEILTLSAAGVDFLAFTLLPGGQSELATRGQSVRGDGPWRRAGKVRATLVWDGPAEEATLELAANGRAYRLRARRAEAPLEPAAEIELRFQAANEPEVRDVVVSATPRASTAPSPEA